MHNFNFTSLFIFIILLTYTQLFQIPVHGQTTSNTKLLDTPLSSQGIINYYLMDYNYYNQDQNYPKYRELTGGIYPIILKHFETINYIENQCVKLRQRIEHEQQSHSQDQLQLIQQLAQLSAQKVKLAYQCLIEMRNERDQLLFKEYQEEHRSDSDVLEKIQKVNGEPFQPGELPFTAASLLQNVMFNSFAGVNGVQNILPIKQQQGKNNEWKYDEKHVEMLRKAIIQQLEECGCNTKNTTLAVQENLCGSDITNYNLAFLSCFYGQKITAAKPEYDQANAVISAFSQIPPDEFQLQKRIASVKNKGETLMKLQQKFIELSKEIEQLWADQNIKKGVESKFVPEKIKIGQIIQFGNFPFFSSVSLGQSAETTQSTVSITSTIESSQDLTQESESSISVPEVTLFDTNKEQTTQQVETQSQLQSTQTTTGQKRVKSNKLQTVDQYISTHGQPTHKCKPSCKLTDNDDQRIQCASCEKCPFSIDGWWHISCLKLSGWTNFEQEFYCPGCWILKGNCFSDYVKNFDGLTSKQKDKVRENANKIFVEEYEIKLKRV